MKHIENLLSWGWDPLPSGRPIPKENHCFTILYWMLGLPGWRLISFGENKKPLPSILNCWLQVLPVATLEVALAASGPDVMKLLRPDRLC